MSRWTPSRRRGARAGVRGVHIIVAGIVVVGAILLVMDRAEAQ